MDEKPKTPPGPFPPAGKGPPRMMPPPPPKPAAPKPAPEAKTGAKEAKEADPTRFGDWEKKGRCIDF